MLFTTVGGIGLFLMGMVLLTDGLKSLAGDALRRALVQFTGGPFKAFASGAVVTALVQSSSATTVTVIGFVSAGVLTFPQAVCVVIGASLGTTCTGWIVSILGLQVSVGYYALPLVGVGAFMRLLGRGRGRAAGTALAGFGLIFVGIETLRAGMQELSGEFTLAGLPPGGWRGHLLMVLIGAVMTVVMQSSSAAVATTLTAMHTGSVNFEQAAALVIGAAIGTTVTGALAAIGANVPAKRTALAHVLFNLATGLIALVLLPVFLSGIAMAQQHLGLEPGAMSLAAFHTAFIAVGVAMFLPIVDRFSRWIERLLPDRGPALTRHLDDTVLSVPSVALEATRRSLSETACELFRAVSDRLAPSWRGGDESRPLEIEQALEHARHFLARIPPLTEDQPISLLRIAQMHAIDHLIRLQSHLLPPPALHSLLSHELLHPFVSRTRDLLELAEAGLSQSAPDDWLAGVERMARELADLRREQRPSIFRITASGGCDPALALDLLDAMRWLDRVGYHTWRIGNYLGGDGRPELAEVGEQPHLGD
jgi:phosphate:Na+ symporter